VVIAATAMAVLPMDPAVVVGIAILTGLTLLWMAWRPAHAPVAGPVRCITSYGAPRSRPAVTRSPRVFLSTIRC